MRATGGAAKTIGSVTWGTAKVAGNVLKTTGDVAWKAGEGTTKGIRTVIYIAKGKQIIPLEKQGNSFYAQVRLNKRMSARFLVDTGASRVQISKSMAERLGINLNKATTIPVSIAGGHIVSAKEIVLKEVKVGRVKVKNIKAVVLAHDKLGVKDGLLGMSFLNHFLFQIDAKKAELILQQRVEE